MQVLIKVLVLIVMTLMIPMEAMAYSYGDPSEEQVAITYNEMINYLDEDNFQKAQEHFSTVEEEIRLHMGDEVVNNVENAFEDKDKDAIIEHMQTILVLNISRRLEGIEQKFDDVDKNKVLLAKANATYKALSPIIQNENAELDATLKEEFENALTALGNPGLFGVGEQKADIEAFKSSKKTILNELKQFFDLESVNVGHYSGDETKAEKAEKGDQSWTDYGQLKNWVPIIILALIIIGVIVYVRRKR